MAIEVDSIVAQLEVRLGNYVANYEKATGAVQQHTAALKGLVEADAAADKALSKPRRSRKNDDEKAAAASAKSATRERERAETAAAKAVADATKAAEREKQSALKATAAEQAKAARSAEKAAAAEIAAADAAVQAVNREIAAHERLAAVVARAAEAKIIAPGTGAVIGATSATGDRSTAARQTTLMASTRIPRPVPTVPREIDYARADLFDTTRRARVANPEDRVILQDEAELIRRINTYKAAGLSETEAQVRAEREVEIIEGQRVARAAELAAAQRVQLEQQLRASSVKTADKISLLAPTIVGGIGIAELSAINDEYIKFSNSLKVAGVSSLAFNDIQHHLLETSTRTGTNIGALSDTYRSIALASHDLGASQDDILKVTDAVANSLRITGASGTAARGAILQLGHAFETGKVTAREFNGLALNAYPILQAAAAGSDKFGGSVAKLRAALIAGDLPSKDFFEAILKGSDNLEARANKAALTTAQGFTALRNALVIYIGSADQAGGVSATLGSGLQALAQNLDIVIPAIATLGTALTVGYISRTVAAAAATQGLGASLLATFGGPVGIAITALTIGVGSFYSEVARSDAVVTRVNETFDEMRERLQATGDKAGLAAIHTAGLGNAAQDAVPGVDHLTGKVRGLADELYRQADAAKKARIATAAKAVSEAETQESAAAAETPAGRNDASGLAPGGFFNFRNLGQGLRSLVGDAHNFINNGAPDRERNDAYRKAFLVTQQAKRDLAEAYQGDNGGGDAPGLNAQATKALGAAQRKLAGLQKLETAATGRHRDRIEAQIKSTEQFIANLKTTGDTGSARAGVDPVGRGGRRGPSEETLAHRAEAARLRAVRDDEAFNTALKQGHDQELQAQVDLSNDAGKRAELERQRLRDASAETIKNINAKGPKATGGTGEYDAGEVLQLLAQNQSVVGLRTQVIDQGERRRIADETLSISRADLENQKTALQSRLALATTVEQRRDLQKQLLDLDYQQREIDLRATIAPDSNASAADKTIATRRLALLPAQKVADQAALDRQNESAGKGFTRGLNDFNKDDFFDAEKVKGLEAFNSGLDQTISKSLHIHGIFGSIIDDLIDMAVKQALIKPLANSLFGGSPSAGGGGLGGLLGSIFGGSGGGGDFAGLAAGNDAALAGLPGFANGGSATIGGNPGIDQNVLSINGQPRLRVGAGEQLTVTPNVAASNRQISAPAAQVSVIAPQYYDLTGVLMTEDVLRSLDTRQRQYADTVAAQAGKAALGAVPGRVQSYQTREG